jgi:hypothetical protein
LGLPQNLERQHPPGLSFVMFRIQTAMLIHVGASIIGGICMDMCYVETKTLIIIWLHDLTIIYIFILCV